MKMLKKKYIIILLDIIYWDWAHPILKNQKKLLKKKDYFIYQKLCELVNSSRIVEATNDWFIVEIDVEENNHLV